LAQSNLSVEDKAAIEPTVDPFDLGFTTHEESCDSDASESNISSISSRKRPASPDTEKSFAKSTRINPGTILASLAFLFLFRASIFDKGINKAASSLVPVVDTIPVRHGRVLFGMDDEKFNAEEEESDSSLALITSTPVQLSDSVPLKSKQQSTETNKSYFFCPTKFHSPSGSWSHFSNKSQSDQVNTVPRHKRRLRAKDTKPPATSTPPVLTASESSPSDVASSLVLRDSPKVSREQPSFDEDSSFRHLTLVVPSSSIDGFSSLDAQSNWLEIDCRMQSAKFIDFK
jgi:hypothetical protein